jgi:hypothetical protein
MLVKLKRTASDLYTFSMTGRADGENYSTTINTALPVNGISFYIGNQNSNDGQRNIYFNNFSITSVTSSTSELNIQKATSVFPNPVSSQTALQLQLSTRPPGIYTVMIYNMAGMRMQQTIMNHPGGTSVHSFKLNRYQPGMYFAEINGQGKRETLKFIVSQ